MIRELRKLRNLTQRDLAHLADVDEVTIVRLEADLEQATVRTLRKIAKALDVSASLLRAR